MATIVDLDDLRLSSQAGSGTPDGEVFINATSSPPTIELISTTEWAGSNFTAAEGVSLQALYSFLKDQWKNNDTDDWFRYNFPMEAITSEQFEFVQDWEPFNDTTRSYIRTGGWSEKDASNPAVAKQEWLGVITLGSIGAAQTAYYAWYNATTEAFLTSPANFSFFGPVNQAVKIYGDASNGNFDYRLRQLFVYIRPTPTGTSGSVTGYTFDQSSTVAIGSGASVTTQVYRFPLTTATDLDVTLTDAEVAALITSAGLEILFDQTSLTSATLPIALAGGTYNFTHLIRSSNGDSEALTPSEVYNFVQYSLRQSTNINDDSTGARIGQLTEKLAGFVGSVLQTFAIGSADDEGVMIDNIDTGNTANFKYRDNTNVLRAYPTVASGTIVFNNNLIEDPSTRYWMFYQNANSGSNVYPGSTALLAKDFNGNDITGYLHIKPNQVVVDSATLDGTITAGTSTLTSTSGGFTLDSFNGKVLRITAGNNIGFYFITDTTANTIVINGTFESTDGTDTASWQVWDKNTAGTITWDFNYDDSVTRGDGSTADAPVSVVSLGLENAQFTSGDFTISSASGQSFSIVGALERNYSDPA